MGTDRLGAIVLRVQADEASASDVRILVHEIAHNERFRQRCRTIGQLTRDIEGRSRQGYAGHCLTILYSWIEPPDDTSTSSQDAQVKEIRDIRSVPMKNSPWASHTWRGRDDHRYVTGYLFEVLRALEDFWNVPGHLVNYD